MDKLTQLTIYCRRHRICDCHHYMKIISLKQSVSLCLASLVTGITLLPLAGCSNQPTSQCTCRAYDRVRPTSTMVFHMPTPATSTVLTRAEELESSRSRIHSGIPAESFGRYAWPVSNPTLSDTTSVQVEVYHEHVRDRIYTDSRHRPRQRFDYTASSSRTRTR